MTKKQTENFFRPENVHDVLAKPKVRFIALPIIAVLALAWVYVPKYLPVDQWMHQASNLLSERAAHTEVMKFRQLSVGDSSEDVLDASGEPVIKTNALWVYELKDGATVTVYLDNAGNVMRVEHVKEDQTKQILPVGPG